jgi:ankyrin repeat protein
MKNDNEALNLFKTYMVLGPDYQRERGSKPKFPKSIFQEILRYAQYEEWIETANNLAAILKHNDLNYLTQLDSWTKDPSLDEAKKWLANPKNPRITDAYEFYSKSIVPLIHFLISPLPEAYGKSALMPAIYYGHTEALKALLTVPGIDVNEVVAGKYNRTPLMWASAINKPKAVETLVAVPGINVNVTNDKGETALMVAARSANTEVLQTLLAVPGIDVNAKDKRGATALNWAVISGSMEAKNLIINHLNQEMKFSRKLFF